MATAYLIGISRRSAEPHIVRSSAMGAGAIGSHAIESRAIASHAIYGAVR